MAQQNAKKQRQQQQLSNNDDPDLEMPNLRYQYAMNEPFVGGVHSTVQSSHEANVHKRRVAYDLDVAEQIVEESLSMEDHKRRMKEELDLHIKKEINERGLKITKDEVDALVVYLEEEVSFGVKISFQRHPDVAMVDFKNEKAISSYDFA
jgi:hypothetical protein